MNLKHKVPITNKKNFSYDMIFTAYYNGKGETFVYHNNWNITRHRKLRKGFYEGIVLEWKGNPFNLIP